MWALALRTKRLLRGKSSCNSKSRSYETDTTPQQKRKAQQWVALPPVPDSTDASARAVAEHLGRTIRAWKWVSYCCPHISRPFIFSLFRSRKVFLETKKSHAISSVTTTDYTREKKWILATKILNSKSTLYLPVSVYSSKISKKYDPIPRGTMYPNADEIKYMRSLLLHKDPAMLILNKPPQFPAQGTLSIHNSMDALAAAALSFEYKNGPRLVHRLDRESSGIIVMGRTQESVKLLHSLFHESHTPASENGNLERRYWALVIGSPKEREGVISAPLTKIPLNDLPYARVIVSGPGMDGAHEAVTEYRVLGPLVNGCSWVELCPRTCVKHQIRVHCAEVLGTPVVGDYKYGWFIHQRWKQMPQIDIDPETGRRYKLKIRRGLNLQKGTVLAKVPLLHLHCRELIIPNIAKLLGQIRSDKQCNSDVLHVVAPFPSHLAMSWNIMTSSMF